MRAFTYEGMDPKGELRTGTLEAETSEAASLALREQGIFVTRLRP